MRRAIVVAAVGLGLVVAAVPTALAAHRSHAGRLPRMATAAPFGEEPDFALRPHTIWYTGDSTGILGRLPRGAPAVGRTPGFLHWKTWTRQRAYAVGTDWIKNCVPDCATSRFYRSSVTVTLTKPSHGHFVKMTLEESIRGKQSVSTWCNYTGYTYWVLPPGKPGNTRCPGPHVL